MSSDVKIDDLFFVSMKDTYFGQMNQRVTKAMNKGVSKGVSKSGRGGGVVGGVGGGVGGGVVGGVVGEDLRADIVDPCVLRIIDDYKPFLDLNYHFLFDSFPSNHIPFVHFLIFLIWFVSPFQFPIQLFDLFSLFLHFNGFPFHSFLFHIKRRGSNSDISGNNGFPSHLYLQKAV
jgi:hypothetical protein